MQKWRLISEFSLNLSVFCLLSLSLSLYSSLIYALFTQVRVGTEEAKDIKVVSSQCNKQTNRHTHIQFKLEREIPEYALVCMYVCMHDKYITPNMLYLSLSPSTLSISLSLVSLSLSLSLYLTHTHHTHTHTLFLCLLYLSLSLFNTPPPHTHTHTYTHTLSLRCIGPSTAL